MSNKPEWFELADEEPTPNDAPKFKSTKRMAKIALLTAPLLIIGGALVFAEGDESDDAPKMDTTIPTATVNSSTNTGQSNSATSVKVSQASTKNLTANTSNEVTDPAANLFVTSKETMNGAIREIQDDMVKQVDFFNSIDKPLEAKRLQERTELDLEMIKELGYCSGIENYSRYMDGREPGTRPFCLLDYFPKDFLMVIDESHATLPQVHAMYGGDRSRKEALVEYGFRLPAAMDNRPLKFQEFEEMQNQVIFVSATPADYELEKCGGIYTEQIIRPTGLLDPVIEVRPTMNQIDDLIEEIQKRVEEDERVLVTTLTKKMAEELTKYFTKFGIRTRYIHSDVETLERIQIMQDLRTGLFDVLVGVNLLREGLDLPEVSLVAILDADKEGMLRSRRSLIQTVGRAARNVNGKAIMYADKITNSMQKTIDETNYRREKQMKYNEEHNKVPTALNKKISEHLVGRAKDFPDTSYTQKEIIRQVAEERAAYGSVDIEKLVAEKQKAMEAAAKNLDFLTAAKLRDEIAALKS